MFTAVRSREPDAHRSEATPSEEARPPGMATGGSHRPGRQDRRKPGEVVAVSKSAVSVTGDDLDDARRVRKCVKNGILGFQDLTPRDIGLLFLYYPGLLAEVSRGE
mgnify:FL=1